MDTETETLIIVLNDRMEKMTCQERLNLASTLMDGYCKECGCEDLDNTCQCWNDE